MSTSALMPPMPADHRASATTTCAPAHGLASAVIGVRPDGFQAHRSPLAVVTVLAIHLIGAWALWQQGAVRQMMQVATPVMVSIVASADNTPPEPPRTQPAQPAQPQPTQPAQPLVTQVVEALPSPVTVQAQQPSQPVAEAAPVAVAVAHTPPVVATLTQTGPRQLPASAVQYLVPPPVVYPRASRRLRETGRVVLRVLIGTGGLPERVQVEQSSGFSLLDEAALSAVRLARFKPYMENGQPQSGWALVPLSFDLDN